MCAGAFVACTRALGGMKGWAGLAAEGDWPRLGTMNASGLFVSSHFRPVCLFCS